MRSGHSHHRVQFDCDNVLWSAHVRISLSSLTMFNLNAPRVFSTAPLPSLAQPGSRSPGAACAQMSPPHCAGSAALRGEAERLMAECGLEVSAHRVQLIRQLPVS